ncbi:hypothetical protein, variant [Aphanomyces astaci]|uniref:Blue (type 1) copper domain-containing protein n=1 Tax=Aphanomyces astaci TaxID=112090 RepID=W4HEU0_APHAT|nr:hypothetical protein, variant [Aphanomyces astaci]ETV89673.1 hypothetical protein, variant [Aphanomyces astaci]|eukprot:XP_009822073.1 hypothetical protein, variant [Aphanomyces astaci]
MPPHAAATVVHIVDFAFVPSAITVQRGASVTWTHANSLARLHTVNSEDGAVESPDLVYGQQFSHTFSTPGTFRCYCHVHSFMSTLVTVVDAPDKTVTDQGRGQSEVLQTSDLHRMSTIDKGHDVDHHDTDGYRALCVAAQNQCMDTMALLVAHGATIHLKQTGGQTALHTACTWGKPQAVEMLLRLGAPVDLQDDNGQAPLHCACQHGDPLLVKLLLQAKADPYIADEHHRIPNDIAHDWKRLDALRELNEYCATTYKQHMQQLFNVALEGLHQAIPSGVEKTIFDFLA